MNPSGIPDLVSRRSFLRRGAGGLGSAALFSLLQREALADDVSGARGRHHAPRAKRVIFLFQCGGPSQLDLWDHKPELHKLRGTDLPPSIRQGQRITGMTATQASLPVAPSQYQFARHGQSGRWVGELLPHTAKVTDDLCVIHSVHTNAINHDPGITFFQTGSELPGRPSVGAWVHYGLGSLNEDLPAYVTLISNGDFEKAQPIYSRLWGSGFLPGAHQGVQFRTKGDPVLYLRDPAFKEPERNRALLDTVKALNEERLAATGQAAIETRIRQYEMAYRMQTSVPELADLRSEPEATFDLYGAAARQPGTYAANCLLARRLAERDVRFIQLYHTGWDHHTHVPRDLPVLCRETDQATAALITDLKQRDLLKDTLVVWAGEFGRTTYCQGTLTANNYGRDHHPRCFTIWMAGGGVKPGMAYGLTDEFCYNIVENPVHVHDVQATILHLLGIDHEKLVYKFQGRRYRLTDIHGQVVKPLLA